MLPHRKPRAPNQDILPGSWALGPRYAAACFPQLHDKVVSHHQVSVVFLT
ncbi:hypothetical protein FRAAL6637 [Frankia alni ACN14a]|uniref:Uncharacterized protein n=1 Tax=Frankia alni (strain DSM 45986 / CECT 9034 / ACN14a) TaxID=326424 RepID=Q0RAJ8_FRAAA|nr:hypothetical protein FRAAL6637 [Frankia alni ACN14a]